MAFGDLRGTLVVGKTSVTNPMAATGSVTVSIGDLIVAFGAELLSLTLSGVVDSLGNGYTAQNLGTDGGNVTGRMYYSIATVGGTLTSVSGTFTAGSDDAAFVAAVFAGPFAAVPVDKNPTDISADTTTPFTCPATGVLSQSAELVVCAFAQGTVVRTISASAPNLLAVSQGSAALGTSSAVVASIGYQVVAATTSIAPEFTASSTITASTLHTITFKKGLISATLALTTALPTLALTDTVRESATLAKTTTLPTQATTGTVLEKAALADTLTLPSISATATVTAATRSATLSLTTALPTASLAGAVSDGAAVSLTTALPAPTIAGTIIETAALGKTIGLPVMSLTGTVGDSAALADTLAMPTITATATVPAVGDNAAVNLTLAAPATSMTGTVRVAATAVSVNLALPSSGISGTAIDSATLSKALSPPAISATASLPASALNATVNAFLQLPSLAVLASQGSPYRRQAGHSTAGAGSGV